MKKAERAVLVAIVVTIAVALRWGFLATAQQSNPLRADAGQYAQYAHNLVEHGVYSLAAGEDAPAPDSFRSPGYPLFLAACRVVGGDGWIALAQTLQVVLGAATAWLVYRLARRFTSFAQALTAAALCALSPHLVVASAYVLTECLTTFVLIAGLTLFAGARDRPSRLAASAFVLGCSVLCNETMLFVPFVLAWPLLRRHGMKRAALFVAVALIPFAGWSLRNQTTDLAMTGGARATASISHGSYPGMVYENPRLVGFPYHEDPAQPEFGASWSGLTDVLCERIAERPLRYASWYLLEKPLWLWRWDLVQGVDVYVYEVANSPYENQPVMAAVHWTMKALHVPLMFLAAGAALLLAWNPRRRIAPVPQALGLVAVFGTLAYLPVIPEPRYLQPFRPVIFVLAVVAAFAIVANLRRRSAAAVEHVVPDPVGQPVDQGLEVAEPNDAGKQRQPIAVGAVGGAEVFGQDCADTTADVRGE